MKIEDIIGKFSLEYWGGGFLVPINNIPMPSPGCYLLLNLTNGKPYIGIGGNVERRLKYRAARGNSQKLDNAIKKYGLRSFAAVPLCYCNNSADLYDIEAALIVNFDAIANGYNIIERSGPGALYGPAYNARLAETRGEAWKAKISASQAARLQDPEAREGLSRRAKARMAKPEVREHLSETSKAAFADPEIYERWLAAHNDPAVKEARIASLSAYWKEHPEAKEKCAALMRDPEMQARLLAGRTPEIEAARTEATRAARGTPESRQKTVEASLRSWQGPRRQKQEATTADPEWRRQMSETISALYDGDPTRRAKISETTRAAMADPEVKDRTIAAANARWADPVYRAKLLAAQRARRARERAAKGMPDLPLDG